MSRITSPEVPPLKESESELREGIPNLPIFQKETNFKPMVIIQNKDSDYQILDLGLMVTLDKSIRKLGIWIPETILDEDIKIHNVSMTVDLYIELKGPKKLRLVNYLASIKKDDSSGKFILNKQFVHLAPMLHAGTEDLTCDIDENELQKAVT